MSEGLRRVSYKDLAKLGPVPLGGREVGTQGTQTSTQPGTQMGTPSTQVDTLGTQSTHATQSTQGTQTTQSTQGTQDLPGVRKKDTRAQLNLKISEAKLEMFRAWCFLHHIGQKEAFELALDLLMGTQGTQATHATRGTQGRLGTQATPIDYDEDDVNHSDIIVRALYEEITGRSWRDADSEAYNEVRHYAPSVVQSGVLAVGLRARTQINSFRYFVKQIHQMAEMAQRGDDMRSYRDYLRRRWKERKRAEK